MLGKSFLFYLVSMNGQTGHTVYMRQTRQVYKILSVSRLEAMGALCTYGRIILQRSLDEEVMKVRMRVIWL